MPRARWMCAGLCLAAALAPAAGAQKLAQLGGYTQPKETTLTEIRRNPEAFRDVWVAFDMQFSGLSQVYNPFFTRFVSTDFVSFAAWGDEQELWKLEEFRQDYHFLFVDKRSTVALAVYSMKKFQRARVVGFIRNTFQGSAWVEVTEVEPKQDSLDDATLFHLVRGRTLMKEGKWSLGAAELAKAAARTDIPAPALGTIWLDLATCYMRQGEFPKARQAVAKARESQPGSLAVKELARTLAERPVEGMDNRVDVAGLKDWERPLWRDPAPAGQGASVAGSAPGAGEPVKVTTPPGVRPPEGEQIPATPPAR